MSARAPEYAIVVPTIGRCSLHRLLDALWTGPGPAPAEVVVVDDRPRPTTPLKGAADFPVQVLTSDGRGPAAARNIGWRTTRERWVCFLDDDVEPQRCWKSALAEDLRAAEQVGAAGSQGTLEVPVPAGSFESRPTDDERRTLRLATARWITADMSYRRDALVAAGGFDERFPRAYREDSDLAARIVADGGEIVRGGRRCVHPVSAATWWSSVRAQVGNRDNALMRRKHGRSWRVLVGEGPGRMPAHLATTAAGCASVLAALLGRGGVARAAAAVWLLLTAEFTARRWLSGPPTPAEAARLAASSALIPPGRGSAPTGR